MTATQSTVITPRGRHKSARLSKPPIPKDKLAYLRKCRGVKAHVPITRVREHLLLLHDAGLPYAAIARAAGVASRTVMGYAERDDLHEAHVLLAKAILNVTWRPDPHQSLCLSVGAVRRIQALARLGWSVRWQARQIGVSNARYHRVVNNPVIAYDKWAAIRDLYNRYSMTPGPNQRAINEATKRGWLPPLAWDDDDLDNPWAGPARPPKDDLPTPSIQRLERLSQVEHMLAQGMDLNTIASRLGVTAATICRDRQALREAA